MGPRLLQPLRGMQDLLPAACARLNAVRDAGFRVAARYGFREVRWKRRICTMQSWRSGCRNRQNFRAIMSVSGDCSIIQFILPR